MQDYKTIIKKIKALNWKALDESNLQNLMILSAYSALEFAESLQIALFHYPNHLGFKEMAKGELNTKNLAHGDYNKQGNHSEFLWHFIKKYSLVQTREAITISGTRYIDNIRQFDEKTRVMSIISREHELPGIFQQILTASSWNAPGLPEFKYYIETHVTLDSNAGGHADLVSDLGIGNEVEKFYRERLKMYTAIPELFENQQD